MSGGGYNVVAVSLANAVRWAVRGVVAPVWDTIQEWWLARRAHDSGLARRRHDWRRRASWDRRERYRYRSDRPPLLLPDLGEQGRSLPAEFGNQWPVPVWREKTGLVFPSDAQKRVDRYFRGGMPHLAYHDWTGRLVPQKRTRCSATSPDRTTLMPHQATVIETVRHWLRHLAYQQQWRVVALDAGLATVGRRSGGSGRSSGSRRFPLGALVPSRGRHRSWGRYIPKGLLVLHSVGSGKTALMVGLMDVCLDYPNLTVVIVTSNENLRELVDPPAGGGTGKLRKEASRFARFAPVARKRWHWTQYGGIRVPGHADIFRTFPGRVAARSHRPRTQVVLTSYTRLANKIASGEWDLDQTVVLMDEVQNILRPEPTFRKQAQQLRRKLREAENCLVVPMTATVGDTRDDLCAILNLIQRGGPRGGGGDTREHRTFRSDLHAAAFRSMVRGKVSYVRLHDPMDFPRVRLYGQPDHRGSESVDPRSAYDAVFMSYVERVRMGLAQTRLWRLKLAEDFARMAAAQCGSSRKSRRSGEQKMPGAAARSDDARVHRVFRCVRDRGFHALRMSRRYGTAPPATQFAGPEVDDVGDYSAKIAELMRRIRATETAAGVPREKWYVYASEDRKGGGGIWAVETVLRSLGYRRAGERVPQGGRTPKRYVTSRSWNGDAGRLRSDLTRFNAPSNVRGTEVQIMLASRSYREGLDLKAVRHVVVMEPLPVSARIQLIGRADRFCSHIQLPPAERTVTVHDLISEPALSELVGGARKGRRRGDASATRGGALDGYSDAFLAGVARKLYQPLYRWERILMDEALDRDVLRDIPGHS